MKNLPAYGWAIDEEYADGWRPIIQTIRRTRAESIDSCRQIVGFSDSDKSWAVLKRKYNFKVVRVCINAY